MTASHADAAAGVDAFLDMLLTERGASANTIDAYRRDLARYAGWCARRCTRAERADDDLVRAYAADLRQAGYARRSAQRHLSAIRQFHRFLVVEGWRADDPTRALDSPKSDRPLPRTLSEADVDSLLAAAAAAEGPAGRRLACLVELLYAGGLRVSELAGLTLDDLDLGEGITRVRGKGGKERVVPLGQRAQRAVADYLEVRATFQRARADAGYLFPSRSRQGYLTRQRILQLLKALALEVGIEPARLSPHVLRHAFATHLLANGMDLRVLQALLGHADIATTEIYTHLDRSGLARLVETHHPLASVRRSKGA
ncbi:MAG: site-specific tyrosine recombinase XerD [Pseudomonadota bacterium]